MLLRDDLMDEEDGDGGGWQRRAEVVGDKAAPDVQVSTPVARVARLTSRSTRAFRMRYDAVNISCVSKIDSPEGVCPMGISEAQGGAQLSRTIL